MARREEAEPMEERRRNGREGEGNDEKEEIGMEGCCCCWR